jgi:hypothetical protein
LPVFIRLRPQSLPSRMRICMNEPLGVSVLARLKVAARPQGRQR